MPGPLDWWNRVRRAVGPPGPSTTRSAVPSNVDAARRAELASVFAHVDRLELELRAAEAYSDREVATIRARAEQDVVRLDVDADERAERARAAAAVQRRTDLASQETGMRAEAEARATALQRRAVGELPDLIDRAVELVRSYALECGTPTARSGSDA